MRTAPRPPLTKRLKPAHWKAIDYGIGVLLGLVIFATIRVIVIRPPGPGRFANSVPALVLTLGVAVGVAIAVATRRKHPVASLCLLLGGSVLVTILSGGNTQALGLFVPVAYVLYFIVATFDNRRSVGHIIVTVFTIMTVDAIIMIPRNGDEITHGGGLIPVIFCLAIAWSLGYIVRQRRRYAIGLQDEAASKAVAVERLRIARELHDVVAHSMSVIAVQAGYGQYVIDSQPADARQALGAIQATSREALEEMRRMLGALRYADETGLGPPALADPSLADQALGDPALGDPARTDPALPKSRSSAAAPLYPAPGLADLDRLLSRTAGAGVRAEVHRLGTPRELPASIDLSAYRIIQEALTNVVKHAHASACSVLIDYGDDELAIEITDSGAGVSVPAMAMAGGVAAASISGSGHGIIGSGHGIIGMRERVSLLGGEFSAGPLPGYGFQVSARIPVPPNGAR